ncbi:MAG: DNA/RNA non-specific endonuclease, partial [Kiritimatiellae bacterium]|nr:DNA/RNA non-specific endonuclease [Kiritimatiellia bacterium]
MSKTHRSNQQKSKKRKSKAPRSLARRIVLASVATIVAAFVALCVFGVAYVRHSPEWLAEHRSFLTMPLEYLGDRTAFITDGLGWTGHDCVYEFDEPAPSGQVLFAGAPVRTGAPAPSDLVTLDRGDFLIGWSPSLRRPVWAAYHVPKEARFEYGKRPAFQKDRSVATSPIPGDYRNTPYDRGHMVPNRAIVTRFGPDVQKKTFLMTNVAPQRPSLNRGPWREMEQRISDLWTQKYGEMWVIVGSLASTSQSSRESLPGTSVNVPEKYYMIVAGQGPDGVRALAVLLDQSAGRGHFPGH